jgi:glutaminyl-peptide cyclotransferase
MAKGRTRRQRGLDRRDRVSRRVPLRVRLGALGLALVVVLALGLALVRGCAENGGGGGNRPAFDGEAALELVEKQVAFGPRVPNTDAHRRTLAFLQEYLAPRADSLSVHEFTHVPVQGDTLRLANVVASFAPAARSRVMLAAHWDTRPVAEKDPDPARRGQPIPGANDGASGTAVLLVLADVLSKKPPPAGYGVDLVFLDGEDFGHEPETLNARGEDMYLGAKEFARTHAQYRPLFGILLDLVGDADPVFRQEGYSLDYAPEVVRRVWRAAEELGHGEIFQDQPLGYITDDHLFLNQAGIRTLDVIDFDYPHWHTHADTPENMSAESLGIVGEVLLEVLYNRI